MKVGENLNVEVQGIVVAQAVITELTADAVTFVIPGTEVTARIRQTIIEDEPEREVEVDRVLLDDAEGGTKNTNDTREEQERVSDLVVHEPLKTKGVHNQKLDSSILDD